MFHSFRRHQHWIWIVLTIVIIISFVIFFSPNVNCSQDAQETTFGSLKGKPITQRQFQQALAVAEIDYLFRYGQWSDRSDATRRVGFDVESEAYNRLLFQ